MVWAAVKNLDGQPRAYHPIGRGLTDAELRNKAGSFLKSWVHHVDRNTWMALLDTSAAKFASYQARIS